MINFLRGRAVPILVLSVAWSVVGMTAGAGARPPWLLALLAAVATAVAVTSVSLFGFFWIHSVMFMLLFLAYSEQDQVLRALYAGGGILFVVLAVTFWLDHLRVWAQAGRLTWLFKWAWARRLVGVATGEEYLRSARTRSGRRPWAIVGVAQPSGVPPASPSSDSRGVDEVRRSTDVGNRTGSAEIKRLADLAARTFWGASVDTLTTGLPVATAELLIEALAGVGKRIEAGELPEIERRLQEAAAARSSARISS